jgi:hypothetical protein
MNAMPHAARAAKERVYPAGFPDATQNPGPQMSEHQRETAFLRRIILHADTDESRELEKRIVQVQRDQSCVGRAALAAGLSAALTIAGFGYGAVLEVNFLGNESQLVIRLLCSAGLASLICLLAFVALLGVYRQRLNGLREECRQLITKLVVSRMGEPQLASLPGDGRAFGNGEAVLKRTIQYGEPPLSGKGSSD